MYVIVTYLHLSCEISPILLPFILYYITLHYITVHYIILYIVNYVFLLCLCILIVTFLYSYCYARSVLCTVLCVNVYCTIATAYQPNFSQRIYHIVSNR